MKHSAGFTLVEMITVITLTAIIAALVGRNIVEPVEGFVDLSMRAALVDAADLALQRMSREVRLALPNSVRIRSGASAGLENCSASAGTVCAVEILRTMDGGQYREEFDGTDNDQCAGPDDDRLDFSAPGDCFEILGSITNVPVAAGGATQLECLQGNVDCLVIFNTGQGGANAYAGDNIAGIQVASATAITFDISGGSATRFPLPSPRQRFHLVDMPVSFVCDTGVGTLTRFADYDITPAQSTTPGGSTALLSDKVQSCTFRFTQGVGSRNALLTVTLVIRDTDTQGNTNDVRLVEQISVPNIP
jgi:MSHA biogenesis protein MshO